MFLLALNIKQSLDENREKLYKHRRVKFKNPQKYFIF